MIFLLEEIAQSVSLRDHWISRSGTILRFSLYRFCAFLGSGFYVRAPQDCRFSDGPNRRSEVVLFGPTICQMPVSLIDL
jgi:hypothetical protein